MMAVALLVAALSGGAVIVLPDSPSSVERSAAAELQDGLRRMGGSDIPVVTESADASGWRFCVGATRTAAVATNAAKVAAWAYDEIFIGPVDGGIVLTGHPTRGALYAVDTLLEEGYGVRWWTSIECFYPHRPALPCPRFSRRHAPKILYRESYFKDAFNADFKVRCKGNFSSLTRYMLEPMEFIPREKGGDHRLHFFEGRRSAYHSFFQILPPERHFAAHPDWYSMGTNGVRQTTQLCLSNDEMTEAFVREARRILRADSDVDFISVSQNDASTFAGMAPCACPSCRAIEEEEGGVHSGPILRFANRVAEALEREFPNVRIDTFAYSYSRQAPRKAKARHNVIVRFCDIGCPVAYPMDTKGVDVCEKWMRELVAWNRVAPGRLFVWDYVANFKNYMLPHPNLYALAENVRVFADGGAVGLFEQGDALCEAGDFCRLKHYVLSHVMWDTSADEHRLIDEFLRGYYGEAAAPHLKAYLDLVNRPAILSRVRTSCYHADTDDFMVLSALHGAWEAMTNAVSAAEKVGEPYAGRVRREKLSIDNAMILRWEPLRKWFRANWQEWPLETTREEAIRRWRSDCLRFGVRACSETTEPNLDAYVEGIAKGANP